MWCYPDPMKQELEPHVMAAWEAMIRTVAALLKKFDRELLESHGLSLSSFDVLMQLTNTPDGRLRMQNLADSVVLSRSGLTRLIDRMEVAGLVRREPFPEDRRGYHAVITDEGRQLYLRVRPVEMRAIQEHFGRHLDYSDLLGLSAALRKVMAGNDLG